MVLLLVPKASLGSREVKPIQKHTQRTQMISTGMGQYGTDLNPEKLGVTSDFNMGVKKAQANMTTFVSHKSV